MELQKKIDQNYLEAMRNKDAQKLGVLRMLKASLKNKSIELKGELSDEDILAIIKSEVKKRAEAAANYETGGRNDLAEIEKAEMQYLKEFMPEQLGEAQIGEAVARAMARMPEEDRKNFGKVMGEAMTELKGKADGKMVGDMVKKMIG
jgi:uncharacterized protein